MTMPRPATSKEPRYLRRRARYLLLRQAGLPAREAESACEHPQRFADAATKLGIEAPADLLKIRNNGRERNGDPASILRSERYHALRALGQGSTFCSYYSKSDNLFARGKRIIAGEESE